MNYVKFGFGLIAFGVSLSATIYYVYLILLGGL